MTSFTEPPDLSGANLHLAVSRNGLHWTPLNQNAPVATPTGGDRRLRDPCIHRSYNFPDRYLRHSGSVLRIDPISASSRATDRQDATFRITS